MSRLTDEILYELLERDDVDVYVLALDPRTPGADRFAEQRAAQVTVAELAGTIIALRAQLAATEPELRALRALAEVDRERMGQVRLELDAAELVATIDAIRREVERLAALGPDVAQRAIELVEGARGLIRTAHFDRGAAGAADNRLALEVPQRLLDLLAALRAIEADGELVLEGHAQDRTGAGAGEEARGERDK